MQISIVHKINSLHCIPFTPSMPTWHGCRMQHRWIMHNTAYKFGVMVQRCSSATNFDKTEIAFVLTSFTEAFSCWRGERRAPWECTNDKMQPCHTGKPGSPSPDRDLKTNHHWWQTSCQKSQHSISFTVLTQPCCFVCSSLLHASASCSVYLRHLSA